MNDFVNFLVEISKRPEMRSNKVAWTLAKYPSINKATRESFYESMLPLYPVSMEILPQLDIVIAEAKEDLQVSFQAKDFRVKKIRGSNFRCFPKSEKSYGINFCKKDEFDVEQPKSTIILGSNGIGKSSIYDLMEFMYCGRIGEYELRNEGTDEIEDYSSQFLRYLSHLDSPSSEIRGLLETVENSKVFPEPIFPASIRKALIPNSYFISSYDIFSIGRLDFTNSTEKSLHYFIADNLGLKEYLAFLKLLNLFDSYSRTKESRAFNVITKEIETLRQSIIIWSTEVSKKRDEKINLEGSQTALIDNDKISKQVNFLRELQTSPTEIKVDETLKQLKHFKESLVRIKEFKISEEEIDSIEFFEIGRHILDVSKDCPFCQSSRKSTEEIKLFVETKISNAHSFAKARKILEMAYKELQISISGLLQKILSLISRLEREANSQINEIPDTIELFVVNQEFLSYLIDTRNLFIDVPITETRFNISNAETLYLYMLQNEEVLNQAFKTIERSFVSYFHKRAIIISGALSAIEGKLSPNSNDKYKRVALLNEEIKKFTTQIENATVRLEQAEKEQSLAQQNLDIYKRIKKETSEYKEVIKSEIDSLIKKVFDPISAVVENLINEFKLDDDIEIKVTKGFETDRESGEIISEYIKVVALKGDKEVDVKKYLNTFRYKLFSLILGFSIAIANRNNSKLKINMPFVIDDIFYSSDFERRLLVEQFIGKLYDLYEKYCPELPLQLILFTHDELIFDCVMNMLTEKGLLEDTIFSRLLHHNESEEEGDYKELGYRIPDNISSLISKNIKQLMQG